MCSIWSWRIWSTTGAEDSYNTAKVSERTTKPHHGSEIYTTNTGGRVQEIARGDTVGHFGRIEEDASGSGELELRNMLDEGSGQFGNFMPEMVECCKMYAV
jgi:hypothetical protein